MNLKLTKFALFAALALGLSASWLPAQERYRVVSGDNLGAIGQKFNIPYQDIMAANALENTTIYVGQELIIPKRSRVAAPPHNYPRNNNSGTRISAPSAPMSPVRQTPNRYNPVPPAPENYVPEPIQVTPTEPVIDNTRRNEHQCNVHYRGSTYVVERGDSVRSISKKFGVAFWDLRTENDLWLSRLTPGMVLKIPTRPSTVGVAF